MAPAGLYGGTLNWLKELEAFGITTRLIADFSATNVEAAIDGSTRFVFTEIISNPKLEVVDVRALAETAHKANIPLIVVIRIPLTLEVPRDILRMLSTLTNS